MQGHGSTCNFAWSVLLYVALCMCFSCFVCFPQGAFRLKGECKTFCEMLQVERI